MNKHYHHPLMVFGSIVFMLIGPNISSNVTHPYLQRGLTSTLQIYLSSVIEQPQPSLCNSANIALHKTAVASSMQESWYGPEKAVDGDNNTRWSSQFTDTEWMYVDLGSVATVECVVFVWENAYGKSYTVDISNDTVAWTPVYTETNGDGNTDIISFTTSISSRYVRMHGIQRGTGYGYSLYEFEIHGNYIPFSHTVFLPIVTDTTKGIEIGAFVGVSPPTTSTVRAFENLVGRHMASVLGYQAWGSSGQPSFPCSDLEPVLYHDGYDTNISFHLTWEPWVDLTDIANGVYDAYLTSYANEVKNCGLKVRLRFAHEMIQNDTLDGQEWYPWQDQPEPYKGAFRHIHDVFRATGANNVEFVWCPQNQPSQLNIVQKYYPGPAYVDWLCFDGYKLNGSDWTSEWFDDIFYNIYHTFVDNVSVFGERPVMIGEFAACEGPVKPPWITNAFAQMKSNYPKIATFYWFNINKECDWRVESSPQSLLAFTTAISSTDFVSHPISTTNK